MKTWSSSVAEQAWLAKIGLLILTFTVLLAVSALPFLFPLLTNRITLSLLVASRTSRGTCEFRVTTSPWMYRPKSKVFCAHPVYILLPQGLILWWLVTFSKRLGDILRAYWGGWVEKEETWRKGGRTLMPRMDFSQSYGNCWWPKVRFDRLL